MLGDPLFLVTTCTGSGYSANRCADSWSSLSLLGLRDEGEVSVVTKATKASQNDRISRPARKRLVSFEELHIRVIAAQFPIKPRAFRFYNCDNRVICLNTVFLSLRPQVNNSTFGERFQTYIGDVVHPDIEPQVSGLVFTLTSGDERSESQSTYPEPTKYREHCKSRHNVVLLTRCGIHKVTAAYHPPTKGS